MNCFVKSLKATVLGVSLISALMPMQTKADEPELCKNPATEQMICGLQGAPADYAQKEAKRLAAFNELKYKTLQTGFIAADKNCGLKPDAELSQEEIQQKRALGEDSVSNSIVDRYTRSFDSAIDSKIKACTMLQMHKTIMAALTQKGIDTNKIASEYARFKSTLKDVVKNEGVFNQAEIESISAEIDQTVLVTADKYEPYHAMRGDMPHAFAEYCPINLGPSAFLNYGFDEFKAFDFYRPHSQTIYQKRLPTKESKTNILIACPGLLLELLHESDYSPFANWTRIIGHELSHNFHAFMKKSSYVEKTDLYDPATKDFSTTKLLNKNSSYFEHYSRMSSCLRDNYANHAQVENRIHSKFGDDDWSHAFYWILGRNADDFEMHLPEISADFWGVKVMNAWIQAEVKSLPAQDDASRVQGMVMTGLRLLCPPPGTSYTLDFAGSHPSVAFRMRNALRNPDLRKQLGCTGSQGEDTNAWCGI